MPAPSSPPRDAAGALALLRRAQPQLWTSPVRSAQAEAAAGVDPDLTGAAAARFERFRPLVASLFPELAAQGGRIRSALRQAPRLQEALGIEQGQVWIKCDHALPVAGSIKARGGFHEVFELAERIAAGAGTPVHEDASALATPALRALFGEHEIAVGSTGNLGMAIGVMAAALGFRAVVHMSADAKAWKKARLRARGVTVVEHAGDYADAVAAGRRHAAGQPHRHFIDDENSASLFAGYSTAGAELQEQLAQAGVAVDARHPLFVYLPCGVGGAPAGITHGLAGRFGPFVHCVFAEPVQSPCVLLALLTGMDPPVYDYGLSNRTEADGLAVPRASRFAVEAVRHLVAGVCSVRDEDLLRDLFLLETAEGIRVEPSAAAGIGALRALCRTDQARAYLQHHGLADHLHRATHVVWTTGGLLLPEPEYLAFHHRGAELATVADPT
ncbi:MULTISPECIES: D-serine ammonia-lyase [Ramlibacter]|uniref:Probable D-serine dehydratase n=1 Tax=Ramlibacter pinisoli TaxID=2682844 RepID=A0A6N8ITB0_9BURK|nr:MULTISPECIES: D-serine ammonia-lyase [Ramlibacter]MBA2965224.1 D-serine ammonia-lyase [Ramlibacter sp. CGMCC 1.13660]MVQ30189.1 D-serine ammonia-lyase [Ramlibacter pinisoli]